MSFTKAITANPYPVNYEAMRDISANGASIRLSGLLLGGGGALVSAILSGTASWTPGAINSGTSVTKTVTVTGAEVGNPAFVGVFPALPVGLVASAQVTSGNTATVTLANVSAGTITPTAGSVRVDVFQH